MKTKTILIVLLVLLMPTVLFANAQAESAEAGSMAVVTPNGEYPISDQPISLNAAAYRADGAGPAEEMEFWNYVQELTGVEIEWTQYPVASAAEQRQLMLASGDYPDIALKIGLSDADVQRYGAAGVMLALNDLISDYSPNWSDAFEMEPRIKQTIAAADGSIYALPYVSQARGHSDWSVVQFINKSWLDALGLPIPLSTEELHEVLLAFKDGDPNGNGLADEIPWTFRSNHSGTGYYDLFASFGLAYMSYENFDLTMKDGEVVYTWIQPEVKEGLAYLHTLYTEGLIDAEVFTHDYAQMTAKISASPRLVGLAPMYAGIEELGAESLQSEEYVALPPLTGPNGEQPTYRPRVASSVQRNNAVLFNTNPYPEISMRWLDTLADPDISLQADYGMIDSNMKPNSDGLYELVVSSEEIYNSVPRNNGPWLNLSSNVARMSWTDGVEYWRLFFYPVYEPYLASANDVYPNVLMTAEQNAVLQRYAVEIKSYAEEMRARWIVRGGIEAEWDAYVEELMDLGLEDMMAVYQQALDSYNSN